MVESTLRQFLEHPRRKLIVIIATAAIALVLFWPAVDNYFAASADRSKLAEELEEAQAKVEQLAPLMEKLAEREKRLTVFETEAMSKKNVEEFRDAISEEIQKSGCQIRRNMPQPEAMRQPEFNPEDPSKSEKRGSRYEVVGRSHSLTITGSQSGVVEVMNKIQERKGLVQIQALSIKQAMDGTDATTLDVVLLLLDLVKPRATGS